VSLLNISHVKKAFDGIYALSDVTFDVAKSECVALVGENGAGKSTLMKILSGVWPQGTFEGEVSFEGKVLNLRTPLDGRSMGISIIHQELCLFPKLTAAENLFLTESFPYDGTPSLSLFRRVHWGEMNRQAQSLFDSLEFDVPADRLVEELSVAQQQLIEIARAVHQKARLLILDEPTSALSQAEVQNLFRVIETMRQREMSFIYISHKLDEVFTLADRIVVLRDGRAVKELDPKATDAAEVIRHMVGRPVSESKREVRALSGPNVLQVKNLSHSLPSGKRLLHDITFDVRAGEVLGVAGLMGAGRSELLRSLVGTLPGTRTGEVWFEGRTVDWRGIQAAMNSGVAFVPEDRKKDGLFLDLAIDFNISISNLNQMLTGARSLDLEKEAMLVDKYRRQMGIKLNRPSDAVKLLSGGNQQKVLLAKMVARSPHLLLLDEPTRGIDVGAKEEIYQIIRQLASEGLALVVVSSELPEILSLSDRVMVLREGKATAILDNHNLSQETIMSFAAGGAS
jgi:D-xylose transport system ATP-binding protein